MHTLERKIYFSLIELHIWVHSEAHGKPYTLVRIGKKFVIIEHYIMFRFHQLTKWTTTLRSQACAYYYT